MSLIEAAGNAARQGFCFVSGNAEGLLGFATGLPSLIPTVPGGNVPLIAYENLRRIRARYCDGDGGEDPPPPPFTGGQCAVAYRFQTNNLVTFEDGSTVTITSGLFTAMGPISGLGSVPGGAACGGSPKLAAAVFTASGAVVTGCPGAAESIEATSFALLERVDGLTDDCGSPPPVLPPPSLPPYDVDIVINPSLTIPATIIYAPIQIDVNGTVNIPVEINFNGEFEFNLNGTLELAPEFNFNLDPGDFYPEEPDEPQPNPDPGGDDETTEPEEPEDDPDTPNPIFAVIISGSIQSEARPSGIFQEEGPDIYAPRLGTVRFGSVVGGQIFWSEDIPVKGLRSVIRNPIPWGSQIVVVNAEPGVVLNYSPVRTAPPEWPPFLEVGGSQTSDDRRP